MSTKIILTASVEKLGAEGDTIAVADGYARNYLFPKGMAMPATPANLRRVEAQRKKREQELGAQLEAAKSLAAILTARSCTVTTSAGPDGRIFGSVTAADIVAALKTDGIELDRKTIALEHSIREVGVYDVAVKLHPEVSTKLKVWVVSGDSAAGAPAEPASKKTQKETKKK